MNRNETSRKQKLTPQLIRGEQTSFYIAANDHEVLSQVSRLMSRQGMVGLMDTAGHLHYLVDGSHGSPTAARRILETTHRLMRDRMLDPDDLRPLRTLAVDQVMDHWMIPRKLKGSRYLRLMLLIAAGNDFLLRPISKVLYPVVAEEFKVCASQIERDIRYCLKSRPTRADGMTNTEAICSMSDEVGRLVAIWTQKTELPIVAEAPMGSYEA